MLNNTSYSNDFEEPNNDLLTESDRVFILTTLVEEGYLSEKQAKAAVRAGVWTRNARKAQYKYNKVNCMNEEIGSKESYTENEKNENKPKKPVSYSIIAKIKFYQLLIWLYKPIKEVSKLLILVWLLIAMLLGSAISPFGSTVTKDKNAQAMQQVEIEIVTLKILNKIHDSILKNPEKLEKTGDIERILGMLHNVTNKYWDVKDTQNLRKARIIEECANAVTSFALVSDESEVEAFDTCLKNAQ